MAQTARSLTGAPVVLVVDDEELVRDVVSLMIEESGGRTILAANGPEAVKVFQSAGRIDLIILDFSMPEMNGYETYMALAQLQPDLKVLMVSGLRLNQEAEELLRQGRIRFLPKPFRERELIEALNLLQSE